MNEVVNGIAGIDGVELAVVHRGTGGDFVRTFGIPHKLEAALDVARGTTTRDGRSRARDLPHLGGRRGDEVVRERGEARA